jgi:hypothetical protein
MRHSWLLAALSCLCLFVSTPLFAWELPYFPKARRETEPRIPSPYHRCPTPLREQSHEELFACAEQEFWHAFSDGRRKVRQEAATILGRLMSLTKDDPDGAKRGRLLALRAYLRLSMSLENARSDLFLFGMLERDFKAAKRLDTENKNYDSFLDTIVMARAAVFGNWKKASELAFPAFDILKDHPVNILALSGTTIGFPMSTGVPQRTIEFLEGFVCPTEIPFCTQNTPKAPFARPGLSFHFAEAFARVGNREKTLYYLNEAKQSLAYADWPYQELVEKPLADIDTYMSYWRSFGETGSAFDKVYANQNFGCVLCHGR